MYRSLRIIIGSFMLAGVMFCQTTIAQETEERAIGKFDELSVSGSITLHAVKGTEPKLEIKVKGTTLNKVVANLEARRLKIKMKPGIYKDAKVEIKLVYTDLRELVANNGAEILLDSVINASFFTVKANTGADITLQVNVESIEMGVSEGSSIHVSGKTQKQDSKAVSGGHIDAVHLESTYAYAKANTGGVVDITVTDELEADIGTGGKLNYEGKPKTETIRSVLGGKAKRL